MTGKSSAGRTDRPARVAVIGGGLAGWVAAVAAQEGGARVALVERSAIGPGWSNSLISGGALHATLRDPRTDPDLLIARVEAATDGQADPKVVRAWAGNCGRTIDWLDAHDAGLAGDPAHSHRAAQFVPVKPTVPGLAWQGYGTGNFLLRLRDRLIAGGGRVLQPCRARGLELTAGGWRVELEGADPIECDAVVLCDGGFQANPELMRRYIGTDRVKLRATEGSTGDGLAMGLAQGGVAVNMDGFYGHLLVRAALDRDDAWPYPILDMLASVAILVDRSGRRMIDESVGGVANTNAVARAADPLGCWLIVDRQGWEQEGRIGETRPNPYLVEAGLAPLSAPTIVELARIAGIDAAGLAASIAALGDDPERADPPRYGTLRLAEPPFYAIPLVAGVTFTLGGLRVDGHARCLDAHGTPISGLYAAGGTMGGLHGGPRVGYAGGLLEAAVFGLIAGEHAATMGGEDGA